MMKGRQGRIAPQNTFLDKIREKARLQSSTCQCFVVSNAQVVDFPILYVSEELVTLLGYGKHEMMQQSAIGYFMAGALTDQDTLSSISTTLIERRCGQFEALFYKKNSRAVWLRVTISKIYDDQNQVVLFLHVFYDITAFKDPVSNELNLSSNFSKFAKLAWTMTRTNKMANKSQNRESTSNKMPQNKPELSLFNSNRIPCYNKCGSKQFLPLQNFHIHNNDNRKFNPFSKKTWTCRSSSVESVDVQEDHSPSTFVGKKKSKLSSSLSDDLPQYKHEEPRTPYNILLHYSLFREIWDWLILSLTIYTVVIVPYNLAMNHSFKSRPHGYLMIIDTIVDIFFCVDIFLNFHTTFVDSEGSVIVDEKRIRANYLKTSFVLDIFASLPYDIICIVIFYISGGKRLQPLFSILNVMRLFRLLRVVRSLHPFLESAFALLTLMLSFYMIVAHWFACVWYVIGREDVLRANHLGWLTKLANDTQSPFFIRTVVSDYSSDYDDSPHSMDIQLEFHNISNAKDSTSLKMELFGGPPILDAYITSLYFTMTYMTTIGFGNVAAETNIEKVFCICMMIVASLLYAAIFGHVTTIIHNTTQATARYHGLLNSVKEFMISHQVPIKLRERVLDYIVSKNANHKGVDQNTVLSVCPKDMKADVCVHLNRRVFNSCNAFRLGSDGCLRALAVNFEMIHSAPRDFIFRKGESISELCFVVSGSLEVIQDGEIVAFLSEGDVFGDSCWQDQEISKSAVYVRALTYSDIHLINVDKLKQVLEFYKAFGQTFHRNLLLTYDLSKRKIFYKLSERHMESQNITKHQFQQSFNKAQMITLRKAVQKFKGKLHDASSSNSPYMSLNNHHALTIGSRGHSSSHSNVVDVKTKLLDSSKSKDLNQTQNTSHLDLKNQQEDPSSAGSERQQQQSNNKINQRRRLTKVSSKSSLFFDTSSKLQTLSSSSKVSNFDLHHQHKPLHNTAGASPLRVDLILSGGEKDDTILNNDRMCGQESTHQRLPEPIESSNRRQDSNDTFEGNLGVTMNVSLTETLLTQISDVQNKLSQIELRLRLLATTSSSTSSTLRYEDNNNNNATQNRSD